MTTIEIRGLEQSTASAIYNILRDRGLAETLEEVSRPAPLVRVSFTDENAQEALLAIADTIDKPFTS